MLVASVKFSVLKAGAFVLAVAALAAVALWPRGEPAAVPADAAQKNAGITTNEKRVSYLKSFGWQVEENPLEVVEVTIPERFNDVYSNYNTLQKQQGFDLAKYKGRRVKRWTYRITNYPDGSQEVRANLLIYNGVVVGGDVSTVALNGFMQGLAKSGTGASQTGVTPQSADITQGIFTAQSPK